MTTEFDGEPTESFEDKVSRHKAAHPPKPRTIIQFGPTDQPEFPPQSYSGDWGGRQAGIEKSQTTGDKN